jgi:hypothetical protein
VENEEETRGRSDAKKLYRGQADGNVQEGDIRERREKV